MIRLARRRPTPSMVVALIALFISLGGVSYGLATGSIDSRELKNNSVRGKDIRNNDVRSRDVRNGSLLPRDFKGGQLPAGPTGPTGAAGASGAKGDQGPAGPPGPTASASTSVSPAGEPAIEAASTLVLAEITTTFTSRVLASLALEARRPDGAGFAACRLEIAPSPFTDFTPIGRSIGTSGPSGFNREVIAAVGRSDVLAPGTYRVRPDCDSASTWVLEDADLIVWAVAG